MLLASWAQAVWETDAEGVVVSDSPTWRAYTGQTIDESLGYGWLDAIHPDDRAYAEHQWRKSVAARTLVNAEFRLRAPDGGYRWTNVRAVPVLHPDGSIEKWAGMNIDIDDSKRAEEALRESEEKYRTVFEMIDEGFVTAEVTYDDQGRAVDALYLEGNRAASHLTLGRSYDHTLLSDLVPDREDYWLRTYDRVARTGTPERLEEFLAPLDRWYNYHVSRVSSPGEGGTSPRVAVVFQDVTERRCAEDRLRESERHATLLLAELQHRTRNTLAVIRSIARRTAENSTSVEQMLAHFQGRLDAFSRVQAAVTRSVDGEVELKSLVEDELVAHAARDGDQVRIEGPRITLELRTAERLSLAIHELATNAVKHGALGGSRGLVRICWRKEQRDGKQHLRLTWQESGVDVSGKELQNACFGMELLTRSIPYDLHAEAHVELRPEGLWFELNLPLVAANP